MERSIKKGIKWQIIAAFILCAVFLLAGFALFTGERALADVDEEVDQTLSVSSGLVVHRGQEFDVDIAIANNETGMHAMRLFVTYDRSAMTLVGYQAKNPDGNNWKGNFKAANTDVLGGYSTYGTEFKPFVLLWDSTNKMYGDGVIVTLTFASKTDAAVGDYHVNVAVDAPNTMMTYGKTCSPAVSGGYLEMLYGVYRIQLLDAVGDLYYSMENNTTPISIQDALDEKGTGVPVKAETAQYTYDFVSWREVESSIDGNHVTYMPTYRAVPKPYQLTFRQGIKKEGADTVDYGASDTDVYAEITTYLGEGYAYRNAAVTFDYGSIVVFDDYKPSVDYDRHPDYTFRGWYTDEACTEPVSFATMPAENKILYGYYLYTADPDDITTTKLAMTASVADGYVIATLSVTENFGFNTLRFALDYDTDKLDFVGFLYESDTALYRELAPTFPAINAKTAAGGSVKDEWQLLEGGYSLTGKYFLFENARGNAYSPVSVEETGKLISFKFAIKSDATGSTEIGITIGNKDLTRYIGDGSTWYANATVTAAPLSFVRVALPTAKDKDYVYTGEGIDFEFDSIDTDYCAVANGTRTNRGLYEGEQGVIVSLKNVEGKYVTWVNGETDPVVFPFEIAPKPIDRPAPSSDSFVYDGTEQTYPVAYSSYYYVKNLANTETPSNKRTLAGDQKVVIALTDPANTEWADPATTADYELDFVIAPKPVTMPTATTETYVYAEGADITYIFATVGGSADYEVANDVRVNAGTYNVEVADDPKEAVRVTLKDTANTVWADAEPGEETDPLYFPFVIAKRPIPSPIVAAKSYTGTTLVADPEEDARYTVTENEGGIEKGSYDVKFTFTEEAWKNYAWENSDDDTVTVAFLIVEVANEWTVDPVVWDKVYDGTPIETYAAAAKFGEVTVTFRAQVPAANEEYVATAPTDSGAYYALFTVAETASYNGLTARIAFNITKIELTAPTATVKEYVYTGNEQTYEFEVAGDTEQYNVYGATRTNAGSQSVTAEIKDKKNYVWKDTGTVADKTFTFTIARKQLTIPVSAGKTYIYNGEEQDFRFSVAGDTDKYDLYNAVQTAADDYEVVARIKDSTNYEWADGTTDDKTYPFSIRYPSLTATTEGDAPFEITIRTAGGFSKNSVFNAAKASPNVQALLAFLAAAEKVGAMDDLSSEEAAALVLNKCVVASLNLYLSPADATSYLTEISLPSARSNLTVVRLAGDTVEVFRVTAEDRTVSFLTDSVGPILILADHIFDKEVAREEFLKEAVTCETAAVYYKSCSCGCSSKDFGGETFVFGQPLGHDYDLEHILWNWNEDHLGATACVVCSRDALHVLEIPATVSVAARQAPAKDESGYVDYVASFTLDGVLYTSDPYREILPATGHVYSEQPQWIWKEGAENYVVKAVFVCDCGEKTVTLDATVTPEVSEEKIVYTAQVVFEGVIYRDICEIDRPVAIFLHNDGTTAEDSVLMLPGERVAFFDLEAREGFTFVGWRTENDTLITKTAEGVYPDYRIGYAKNTLFTAEWRSHAELNVSVKDTTGAAIEGANVKVYENEVLVRSIETNAEGTAQFPAVPYGNYKLVVEYPYYEDVMITRSDGLDVDKPVISVTLVLPRSNFNTVVEGDGSAEGLEDVIDDREKNAISDETTGGTINEIVITQKRVQNVSDEVKEEITDAMRRDDPTTRSAFVDYYDVTIVKTTTARNAAGVQYVREEYIKEAEKFQTNIFPLTAAMRAELVRVEGNSSNIFVYKRHTYDTGVVTIFALPKVSEKEGRNAEYECFYIKVVSGVEYIAIRQKEYSVLAFGASPDPILLANEIFTLDMEDGVYGTALSEPTSTARYGAANVKYTYSTTPSGEFVAEKPTAAGTYYLKAFIPATDVYGAAEKVVEFKIARKVVTRPQADTDTYVYNGTEQVYKIAASADYVVTGARQINAGTYVVTVTLVDPANTVWDSGLDMPLTFEFVIGKKKLSDFGNLTFKNRTFWFNGRRHSLAVEGLLPEGVTIEYIGNNEFDLGKFTVTAVFHTTDDNYDVSEPMTAIMTIRLNWIPIVILMVIVFTILIIAIVLVEKLLKRLKESQNQKPNKDGDGKKAD